MIIIIIIIINVWIPLWGREEWVNNMHLGGIEYIRLQNIGQGSDISVTLGKLLVLSFFL